MRLYGLEYNTLKGTTGTMDAFAEQFHKLSQMFVTLGADQRAVVAERDILKYEKMLLETQNNILTAQVKELRALIGRSQICEFELDCDMPRCPLLHPSGWRHEAPAPEPTPEQPVPAPEPTPEQPVPAPEPTPAPAPEPTPAPAPALFKNRNFQKFCAKLDLPDDCIFRTTQRGFTCEFTLHKTPAGYELRSSPFGPDAIQLGICEKAPSIAVKRFRESLKGLNLAFVGRRTLDANGWDHVELCVEGEEGDEWHLIGENCWGISWDTATGEWI